MLLIKMIHTMHCFIQRGSFKSGTKLSSLFIRSFLPSFLHSCIPSFFLSLSLYLFLSFLLSFLHSLTLSFIQSILSLPPDVVPLCLHLGPMSPLTMMHLTQLFQHMLPSPPPVTLLPADSHPHGSDTLHGQTRYTKGQPGQNCKGFDVGINVCKNPMIGGTLLLQARILKSPSRLGQKHYPFVK